MAKLLPGERQLVASSQLAVRMLYAVVREDFTSYDDFFAKLTRISPNLAEQLQPLHVMEFIQTATADASKPTLAVWAFDEVNAVQPTDLDPMGQDGTKVTFLQRQLSEAVLARQAAWLAMKKGRLNLLPVFITASTRGSASSLHSTESRKARSSDVRMALADDMSVKQLVVMDLFRRLPWPKGSERPTMPGPENSLSDLSDAERQQLLDCCPTAVTGVLHWVGSSYRLIEQSVLAMCGCHNGADLNVGELKTTPAALQLLCGEHCSSQLKCQLVHMWIMMSAYACPQLCTRYNNMLTVLAWVSKCSGQRLHHDVAYCLTSVN